jgi:hypothetical protein
VKSLLRQFDVNKKTAGEHLDPVECVLEQEILELGEDIGREELEAQIMDARIHDLELDDKDGLVDELDLMSEDEHEGLQEKIRPVRLVLVKVMPPGPSPKKRLLNGKKSFENLPSRSSGPPPSSYPRGSNSLLR